MQRFITQNQPLTEIDEPLTRNLFQVSHVSWKTLRKYILSLDLIVEDTTTSQLQKSISLMLDGWSENNVHFVDVFGTYNTNGMYHETHIACESLLKEDDLGVHQNFSLFVEALDVFGQELSKVTCIMSDSCLVKKSLARICGGSLVGCDSHTLNFPVGL